MSKSFDAQVSALEGRLGNTTTLVAQFDGELRKVQGSLASTGAGAAKLERTLSRGVARAIDGLVLDGGRLSDALHSVADTLVQAGWRAAVKPVANHLGGLLTSGVGAVLGKFSPFAAGEASVKQQVKPFAKGGVFSGGAVVSAPTLFPMTNGTGLMGEAGPEAIMPLTRGADGRLGVRTQGRAQPVQVVMNIHTPDAQSFARSQSQIAARMGRALSLGQRNQ
jgi:hypothetical protein